MRARAHKQAAGSARDREADADPMAPMPLDEALEPGKRDEMQSLLGADIAGVTLAEAPEGELGGGAVASAQGEQIKIDSGVIDLDTPEGKFVLGHELAHVVQQRQGRASGTQEKSFGASEVGCLEAEADQAGARIAGGQPVGEILGHADSAPQFFGAGEHELMGNKGSGGEKVKLAGDYTLDFGEVVALAGDHFSSIDQMRDFAGNTSGGKGSRLEIDYARNWKLGKQLPWKNDAPHKEAKEAQEKRYYALAGGNEAHYPGNPSHFVNPSAGDLGRSTADKALDSEKRDDDRQHGKKGKEHWKSVVGGKNAVASYRVNHVDAIHEAAECGAKQGDMAEPMAVDAFACHYLTDSFAAGHVRTPRQGAKDYWDPKVPMFYDNLVGYMAQFLYRHLDNNGTVEGADVVTEDIGHGFAADEVRGVFNAKAKLTFGDIVGLAIHDSDNANKEGVQAHVDGEETELVGDGEVLKKGKVTAKGADTLNHAVGAVSSSHNDILDAYTSGMLGQGPDEAMTRLFDPAAKMFKAEKSIPVLTPEDLADKENPKIDWKFGTVEQLLHSKPMCAALKVFAKEKAGELQEAGFTGAKLAAITDLGADLVRDPVQLLRTVINWTPDTGGGIVGQSQDGNARDYVKLAKDKKALKTLTPHQRKNLIVDVYNGYDSEADEETAWTLLETASDADARDVIKFIGWNDLAGFFDGAEDSKFRKRFPADKYR